MEGAGPARAFHPGPTFARQDWRHNGQVVTTTGGVVFRTRGFLPDGCVLAPLPCGHFLEPEHTAQGHVIRALVLRHPSVPTPGAPDLQDPTAVGQVIKGVYDKVHWEVGPSGSWRSDVLVDDGPKPTILEVKRWAGEGTREDVRLELDSEEPVGDKGVGYVQKFKADADLDVVQNDELNQEGWVTGYLDESFLIGCAWADRLRDPVNPANMAYPGNIYYAPLAATPAEIADECALKFVANIIVIATVFQVAAEIVGIIATAYGTATGVLVGAGSTTTSSTSTTTTSPSTTTTTLAPPPVDDPTERPSISPAFQTVDGDNLGRYQVSVRLSAEADWLEMCFGDGAPCEYRAVPAGSGTITYPFQHAFAEDGMYSQVAKMVRTGVAALPAVTSSATASPGCVDCARPMISPPVQRADAGCVGEWTVSVPRSPTASTSLRFEYGDGGVATTTVSQGTGTETFSFSRRFPIGVFVQKATIVESGSTGYALTAHEPPAALPSNPLAGQNETFDAVYARLYCELYCWDEPAGTSPVYSSCGPEAS